MSALRAVTIENLEELDGGKALEAINLLIRRTASDCYDRPGDKRARKVTVEFVFKPVMRPDGSCDKATMQFKGKAALPNLQTDEYSVGLKPSGVFVFNPDSLADVDQQTLISEEQ